MLEQQRGMVDQRDPELIAFHARWRFRWLDVRNESGRWLRPAGELPSYDVEKAARLRRFRIEEALTVKVPRKRRCAGALLHETSIYSQFQRRAGSGKTPYARAPSMPRSHNFVDLPCNLVDHGMQIPVERLHHFDYRLAAHRLLPLRRVIPDVLIVLAVYQLDVQ